MKNQDIFKKLTAQELSKKNVNTSFLMLPLRLETMFMERKVEEIYEPERVFYVLRKVWWLLRDIPANYDESSQKQVTKQIEELHIEVEKLDIMYSDDQTILIGILENMKDLLPSHTEMLNDWMALIDKVKRLKSIHAMQHNRAEELLNRLEHYTRLLINTCLYPSFDGKKRRSNNSNYSQSAIYKTGFKHFKQCRKFIQALPEELKKVPWMTTRQIKKFYDLLSKWDQDLMLSDKYELYSQKINNEGNISKGEVLKSVRVAKGYFDQEWAKLQEELFNNELVDTIASKITEKDTRPCRYTKAVSLIFNMVITARKNNSKEIDHKALQELNTVLESTVFDYGIQQEFFRNQLLFWLNQYYSANIDYNLLIKYNKFIYKKKMLYEKKKKCLCVRIYPDELAVTQAIRPLSENEYLSGCDFWLKYTFNTDAKTRESLWLAICDLYPAYRAAWIIRKTYPSKYFTEFEKQAATIHKKDKTFEDFTKLVSSNFPDAFPKTGMDNSQQMFNVPTTNLLPERFILQAVLRNYQNKRTKEINTTKVCKYGHLLPKTLQIGINLNDLENTVDEAKSNGHVFLNGSLRWMTDYDEAERMGMAITLPLNQFAYERLTMKELKQKVNGKMKVVRLAKNKQHKSRTFFFDAVYVFGINNESEDECKKMLTDLLEAHLYSDDGYSLLNIGTATNILTEEDRKANAELFDTSENALIERYKHQPENCITPPTLSPDEEQLQQLFALDNSVLGNIKDRNNTTEHHDIDKSRKANKALIKELSKTTKILELFKEDKNKTLNDFLSDDVLARGPFPPLRIGSQPYGILPICDFRNLLFDKKKEKSLLILKEILLHLTEKWNFIAENNVNYSAEQKNITADDYLRIAGSTPISSYFQEVQSVKEISNKDKAYKPLLLLPEFFKFTDLNGNTEKEQDDVLDKIVSILEDPKITKESLYDYFNGFDEIPIIEDDSKHDYHHNFSNLQLPNLVHYVKLDRLIGILYSFPDIKTINSDKYEDFLSILNKDVTAEKIKASLNGFVQIPSNLQPYVEEDLVKAIMSEDWSDEEAKNLIIEFFDLFAYRLDAWMMGLLSNKLRKKINAKQHRIAIGSYGWVFNLTESPREKEENKEVGEYILAPSVNQAITGAVLCSAYNNSRVNGETDDTYNVNLSSERVRNAIRIIEGVQNGLAIGTILGTDLERLMHDEYNKSGLDLNEGIYNLRNKYPMVESKNKAHDDIKDNDITVVNGAKLLEEYRNAVNKESFIKKMNLFYDETKILDKDTEESIQKKENALRELIKRIDDEYDALTDVVLSEGVYKLTQGQREAVDALMQALDTGKNIPMPQVAEIPISSAQVDGSLVVALPLSVTTTTSNWPGLDTIEPKVDQWINETLGLSKLKMSFRTGDTYCTKSMQDLEINASELVYLSSNKSSFLRYLELMNWLKEDIWGSFTNDIKPDDSMTFDEMELMLDNMRELLAGARILRNDDLVKETGLSDGANYDKLMGKYNSARAHVQVISNNLSSWVRRLKKNPEEEDYNTTAVSNEDMRQVLGWASHCFSFGQTTAMDAVCKELLVGENTLYDDSTAFLETVKAQHVFLEKMNTICENLKEALEEAAQIVNNASVKTYQTYTEAIQKLLVSNMLIVPSFKPDNNVPLDLLEKQKSIDYFENVTTLTIDENIQSLSKVSPQMMRFHQLRLFQKWNAFGNNDKPATIVPMQIPVIGDGDKHLWLGTEVENEDYVGDAFTYMVVQPENFRFPSPNDKEPRMAGIVLDHWIERIPYREQTAGLSFNFDQPDAEAPQALLLAVATKDKDNHRWSEEMLLNTLRSTMHLVKCRSVEPDDIRAYSWTAGLFPLINYTDTNS